MKDFRERIAVVTGAASGIGRAMAASFLDVGMNVVLADIEEDRLENAVKSIKEAGGNVLMKGLSPQTAEQFGKLFATPLELVADTSTWRPVRMRDDDITAGISNEELYWERRKSRFSWKPEVLP